MKRASLYLIFTLITVVFGCGPSEPSTSSGGGGYDKYSPGDAEQDAELDRVAQEAREIKDAVSELRDEIDSLRSEIENFSDGYTNWRDVVPEVESKADSVESAMSELERQIESWSF